MEFLTSNSVWIYVLIFVGKIAEAFVSIVWVILVSRGERLASTLILGLATALWITITGTVLVGFQEDIYKSIIFIFSSALGTYIGTILEERLALGLSSMQVIVPHDKTAENSSEELVKVLRDNGFAVTVLHGKGKVGMRDILTLHLKRKRIKDAIKIIKKQRQDAVIIVNEIRSMSGGYLAAR